MYKLNFIITLIAIVVVLYIFRCKENFNTNYLDNTENSDNLDNYDNLNKIMGVYNHFNQKKMNPYPLSLNKFFSNDTEGLVD
jgi:hypothetical protein